MSTSRLEIDGYVDRWISNCDPASVLSRKQDWDSCIGGNCLEPSAGQGLMSFGLPNQSFSNGFASTRMWWFPNGIPSGKATAAVSSRIGSRPDTKKYLFDAMRTLACRTDSQTGFLIVHQGTAASEYVSRAADLFAIPIVELRPMPAKRDSRWFEYTLGRNEQTLIGYYDADRLGIETLSIRDAVLVSSACELIVLTMRSGGNLSKCVKLRLQEANQTDVTYYLADRSAISSRQAKSLENSGAIAWYLYRKPTARVIGNVKSEIWNLDEFMLNHDLDSYLAHWTRACHGPWPGESSTSYLDDLIIGAERSDHSKYSTMTRILSERVILASNRLSRSKIPVVCFTQRTVDQFPSYKIFRPHLNRWDFETIGIAIRKSRLESVAQEVVYATESDWLSMDENQRPFFQLASGGSIDWTVEQEWRVVGSVDLSGIAATDAFVFVDCEREARKLASISRWPVVLLPSSFDSMPKS